jgi:hypothetical protein
MGFLQKITSNKKLVFCDVQNINFITFDKEKTGSMLHTTFTIDKMVKIDMLPEAVCNLFRGQFIKVVFTRMNEKEDNSAFYKFHAWLNTANVVFMKDNEVFQGYTDLKFRDGSNVIVCCPSTTIIHIISQFKKEAKEKQGEKARN